VSRGSAYLHQGRPDLALDAVSQVRDEAPGSGEAMTIAGMALIQLGQPPAARLALERALALQPNQFEAAATLAELNFGLGNGRRGIEVLEMAARIRPREFRIWLVMGKVLHDLGDFPKAINAYEKALEVKPDDPEALVGLIGALVYKGVPDQAEARITKALGKYPENPMILGYAAQAAYDAHRIDEASALADRTLQRDARCFQAMLTRARCHIIKSRWQEALRDAEGAVAARPGDLSALQVLLTIERRVGLKERAAATETRRNQAQERAKLMTELSEAISQHPEDPELVWKLGEAARDAGAFLLSARCFEAALALDASFLPARRSLAALRSDHPESARDSGRETLFPFRTRTPTN
jgi:tetratricopeptide (TPR) repeat protein